MSGLAQGGLAHAPLKREHPGVEINELLINKVYVNSQNKSCRLFRQSETLISVFFLLK